MNRMILFLPILVICLVFPVCNSEEENVRQSLVQFMDKLSGGGNKNQGPNWGWNITSDPCLANWTGVFCDPSFHVRIIVLNDYNLTGIFDDTSLCLAKSLINVISLSQNSITGSLTKGIAKCKQLTHLYLGTNNLSGDIPESLSHLTKLKRLDLSYNGFSGQVSPIMGLLSFLVQDNRLSGPIPDFDFSLLEFFNVSNNNFSGPIPDTKGKFKADSYLVNPGLCGGGDLVSNPCPPPKPEDSRGSSSNGVLIYSGYFILALILLILIALKLMSKNKKKKKPKEDSTSKGSVETSTKTSDESKTTRNRSEYSISSVEVGGGGGAVSQSLVGLASPLGKNLRFEDLLRAPAELLGKGKHGSLYKVLRSNGEILTVKRIKDWSISNEDFKKRMERIDQVKHPRSLPALAYYCSKQEKLLVYEYQENGSLFKLLHGSQNGQVFDWENRLSVAVVIAETLTSLHQEFREDGIGHGNLKSTNILFNKKMEPCISEYGLKKVLENQDKAFISQTDGFKLDVYGYGVILLELLTGKLVKNSGIGDLGKWVHSVVAEEWTAEVFDKALLSQGASEERLLNLLQLALKCINPNPNQRPNINQVAAIINSIKEEDERSIISDPSFPL